MNGLGPLLGCEGAGSAAYFGAFGQLLKCNWAHGFSKRVRRPPTDPVNAMLIPPCILSNDSQMGKRGHRAKTL
jgi:hypothetical protein